MPFNINYENMLITKKMAIIRKDYLVWLLSVLVIQNLHGVVRTKQTAKIKLEIKLVFYWCSEKVQSILYIPPP